MGLLVVAPGEPYPADEVAAACETPLVGVLPDDPRAAAVWSDGAAAGRSLSRSPLQRAGRRVAETLAGPELAAVTMLATPGQVAS